MVSVWWLLLKASGNILHRGESRDQIQRFSLQKALFFVCNCSQWLTGYTTVYLPSLSPVIFIPSENRGRILGRNWDKSLESFPPFPLLTDFTQDYAPKPQRNCMFMNSGSTKNILELIKDSVRGCGGPKMGPGYPSLQLLFSITQGINLNIQANSGQTCRHSCQHWNRNKCTKCIYLQYNTVFDYFFLISWFFGFAETTVPMFLKFMCTYLHRCAKRTIKVKHLLYCMIYCIYKLKPLLRIRIRVGYFFDLCIGDPDRGWKENPDPDPKWKNSDPGSGVNILDPQHWLKRKTTTTKTDRWKNDIYNLKFVQGNKNMERKNIQCLNRK